MHVQNEAGWGALTSEQVAGWINFDSRNPDWTYEGPKSESMASRQAEGVAYLWNQLSRLNLAILADEVGMGKTFQALGVAALLWKMKPDAKVLMLAPSRDICAHWLREYSTFVRLHYRSIDHCVKHSAVGEPIQSIHECSRLEQLANHVETRPGHLYLTTIYSLSGLVPYDEKDGDKNAIARANAGAIHDRIIKALDGKGFDLIIIDEAHYFRKSDGGSQRAAAASAFFGSAERPLGQKVLLMTATPSHSSLNDVANILGYFHDMDSEPNTSVLSLMEKYGLRRFRRLESKGQHYSKRQYRNEKQVACEFNNRPESEMFFALYQKKLVTELKGVKENKKLLYGFLEGFESVGYRGATTPLVENDDEATRRDFTTAPDTKLLQHLTAKYKACMGGVPDHPKYGQLVEDCVPLDIFQAPRSLHEDKHLVFVRRIPSVRELTQRINHAYDERFAVRIAAAWGISTSDKTFLRWRRHDWSRQAFEDMLRRQRIERDVSDLDEDIGDEMPEDESDEALGSAIANLFVVKKKRNNRSDCSNVSLRFRKQESVFALFLEPSLDYRTAPYEHFYEYRQSEKVRSNYVDAAQENRLQKNGLGQNFSTIVASDRKSYLRPLHTVWSLVYEHLNDKQKAKLDAWASHRPAVAENFSNYLKTGFLFASPVMVELYCWFTEFDRGNTEKDAQARYLGFLDFSSARLQSSLLLCYFKAALDSFEVLCEKITDHKSHEWQKEWRVLTSLQNPAWYASGQSTNRQRLILGFNSPFYPNVLVATSVFQEGVNLHLECRKVHHYGLAGSPGDNEQRVGRIDRLFGKVNQLLKVDVRTELEINYPFLRHSLDEDQVASFIARKFSIEEKMDACLQPTFNKEIELTQVDWTEFLRKPVKEIRIEDPYPAHFDSAHMPPGQYTPISVHDDDEITNYVRDLLAGLIDCRNETLVDVNDPDTYPDAIALIDPIVSGVIGPRRQPILVERRFSADYSALVGGTVHYLSLRSPISSRRALLDQGGLNQERLSHLCHELRQNYPLVKICLDPESTRSHFYLHARIDLPIFARRGRLEMLSDQELVVALRHIKHATDSLELQLFAGGQDLNVLDLDLRGVTDFRTGRGIAVRSSLPISPASGEWELVKSTEGDIECLSRLIERSLLDKDLLNNEMMEVGSNPLLRALALNTRIPFVSFWPEESITRISLCYPAVDIQLEERKILEYWFDYISERANIDWIF